MRTLSFLTVPSGLARSLAALLATTTLIAPHLAFAQAVERNLPPAQTAEPQEPKGFAPVPGEQDDTPFGPALHAIIFLNANDPVAEGQPTEAIDTSRVPRLHDAAARKLFGKFLNRPLSRKLLSEIQAEIARFYRKKGYPFVSISTPEQEVSSGVLQIRVLEFVAGRVNVQGVEGREADRIREGMRIEHGQTINSKLLGQDIEWQNRNYFRSVEARFKPGENTGEADLDLIVKAEKPWRVYGGYTNSGSPSSGRDRIFVGAMAGRLPLDATISYQMTASPDFYYRDGNVLRSNADYLSHGARISVPTAPRQQIEITLSAVDTNQEVQVFSISQKTQEATVAYRSALSNFANAPGDILAGVEFKRQKRKVYFGEFEILSGSANLYQLFGEWRHIASDRNGRTSLNFGVHLSPGHIDSHNSRTALYEISSGRVTSSRYAYLTAGVSRVSSLGKGWQLINSLSAQFAGTALPLASQMGLGGPSFVRIYASDDDSFDRGLILRNELRTPPVHLLAGKGKFADLASPYVFFDVGYGEDLFAKRDVTIASVGAGIDYQLGRNLSVSFGGGTALRNGPATRSGKWRIETSATLSF